MELGLQVPGTQHADMHRVYLHEAISSDFAVHRRLRQLRDSLLDEMRAVHQELRSQLVPMHLSAYHQVYADGSLLPSLHSMHRRGSQMLHSNSRPFLRLLWSDHQVLGLPAEGRTCLRRELLRSIMEVHEAVHRFSLALHHKVSPSCCVLSLFGL